MTEREQQPSRLERLNNLNLRVQNYIANGFAVGTVASLMYAARESSGGALVITTLGTLGTIYLSGRYYNQKNRIQTAQ